jgi:hypothetical protein
VEFDYTPAGSELVGSQCVSTNNAGQTLSTINVETLFLEASGACTDPAGGDHSQLYDSSQSEFDTKQLRGKAVAVSSPVSKCIHDKPTEETLQPWDNMVSAEVQPGSSEIAQMFDWSFLEDTQICFDNLPQASCTDGSTFRAPFECAVVDLELDTSLSDVSMYPSFS